MDEVVIEAFRVELLLYACTFCSNVRAVPAGEERENPEKAELQCGVCKALMVHDRLWDPICRTCHKVVRRKTP